MPDLPQTSISEHVGGLTDPRRDHLKEHQLLDIVTITLCAVICGADDWVNVATFGRAKEAWLRTFLALPGGIPSHDTFRRVFARLDPEELRRSFLTWVTAVVGAPGQQVVAVDGKTLRGSRNRRRGTSALHLVSAWATANELVLAQVAVDSKSNEITAIPALLCLLSLEGATVTIDAMGCQTAIAAQIVEQGGDYVLTLKDNHPNLHERVRRTFADAAAGTTLPLAHLAPHDTTDLKHDRLEQRRCRAIGDPAYLAYIDPDQRWANLSSVVCITSTRRVGVPPRRKTATISPVSPWMLPISQRRSAAIGGLKTASTGSLMSPSMRTPVRSASDTPPKTSPVSAISRSTSSDRNAPLRAASPPNASAPPLMTPISAQSSLA